MARLARSSIDRQAVCREGTRLGDEHLFARYDPDRINGASEWRATESRLQKSSPHDVSRRKSLPRNFDARDVGVSARRLVGSEMRASKLVARTLRCCRRLCGSARRTSWFGSHNCLQPQAGWRPAGKTEDFPRQAIWRRKRSTTIHRGRARCVRPVPARQRHRRTRRRNCRPADEFSCR
jgi:hypothetical protein